MKKILGLFLPFLMFCSSCSVANSPENRATNAANAPAEKQAPSTSKRAAPTGLAGSPDSADPSTKINISWTRNAADNAFVEIFLDGKYVANVPGSQTSYQIKGLTPGQVYKIKVWNFWAQKDVSDFSNEITVATTAK